MSSVIFFDKKNIEDFVAVSGRVAIVKIHCIDDPGWHMNGLWASISCRGTLNGYAFAKYPSCDIKEAF